MDSSETSIPRPPGESEHAAPASREADAPGRSAIPPAGHARKPVEMLEEEGRAPIRRLLRRSNVAARRRPIRSDAFGTLLTGLQVVGDLAALGIAFAAARLAWPPQGAIAFHLDPRVLHLGTSICAILAAFWLTGLYRENRSLLNIREFELVLRAWIAASAATILALYLARIALPRSGIAIFHGTLLLLLFTFRYGFFKFSGWLHRRGYGKEAAIVYGAGKLGRKLVEKLRQSPKLGIHVAGFIDDDPSLHGRALAGIPVLGDFTDLEAAVEMTRASRLFIALPHVPRKTVLDTLSVCRRTGTRFAVVPSLYDMVVQQIRIDEIDGIPLIGMDQPRDRVVGPVAKRLLDVAISIVLLAALSPLLAAIAATIRLTSPGPVLFIQKRVGLNGRIFRLYKFRSMHHKAPKYATTPANERDPRITPVGRVLRKTSLDELPQLWNVLLGDMSLVGPRPEMPFIVARYDELQRQRLAVKPGITGLWQISSAREFAIHENMDYDVYYIRNQSILLDLVILIRTTFVVLFGRGA